MSFAIIYEVLLVFQGSHPFRHSTKHTLNQSSLFIQFEISTANCKFNMLMNDRLAKKLMFSYLLCIQNQLIKTC